LCITVFSFLQFTTFSFYLNEVKKICFWLKRISKVFKFILTNIDINTPIISSSVKQQVEIVLEKNDNIYHEIKKNERSTNTGYLFKDVKKQNLEKTIEKLETMDNFNYQDITDNLEII